MLCVSTRGPPASRTSRHSGLFRCLPALPRLADSSRRPPGTCQEADSLLLCSRHGAPPFGGTVCVSGQVTFEPRGIIPAAPNCLCLCISLTHPGIGSLWDTLSGPARHTRLHLGTRRERSERSSAAITNKPSIVSRAVCFLGSTNQVPGRPA